MNFTKIIFIFALLLSAFFAQADYGCNTGNLIYPNARGTNDANGDPRYYNTNPITIRWWDQDPNCGIRSNKIYTRTSGDDNCAVDGTNTGVVYYYNPNDNNCIPLPLDDYVWVMILAMGGIGYYILRKKRLSLVS